MSRIEFGVFETDKQTFQPMISIEDSAGDKIVFSSNIEFENLEHAKEIVMNCYMALTGKQNNLKYDHMGDA